MYLGHVETQRKSSSWIHWELLKNKYHDWTLAAGAGENKGHIFLAQLFRSRFPTAMSEKSDSPLWPQALVLKNDSNPNSLLLNSKRVQDSFLHSLVSFSNFEVQTKLRRKRSLVLALCNL